MNSEFLENPSINRKNRPENICEFSRLRDLRDEIPCATEQGINSTTTENLIRANRELIRNNRELAIGTEKRLNSGPLAPRIAN